MRFTFQGCGKFFFALLFSHLFYEANAQSQRLWIDTDPSVVTSADRYSTPTAFRAVELDVAAMKSFLQSAPKENSVEASRSATILSVPLPDGTMGSFSIEETSVMAPGLAAHYPQIKTYVGQGITDRYAYARFDMTQFGFHGMILSPRGDVFIDPVSNESDQFYISYFKKDLPHHDDFVCQVNDDFNSGVSSSMHDHSGLQHRSSGDELRTYRLALACTGEYATKKGGTVSGALAGMVTSVNRVDGVYEQEVSVHLQLIDNDTLLIYLSASTDPYTNNDGVAMLDQNQTNIDNVIGSANYDIGHVFSTGGGGIASLGAVCRATFKAQGVTGLPNPVGDAFDIDFVAHEMGHQFGANHSFNCVTGSCSGNRYGPAAFEPGSGSTIMSYAGICGSTNDLQPHSDAFFHTGSFDEILDYTTLDFGNDCPVIDATGNNLPIANVGSDYSIPISTPFRLDGSGSDADGEAITYMWEEVDHGPQGDWNNPVGQAPCFRSFPEDTLPYRIFPKMSTIVKNYPSTIKGEVLPDYGRSLNFRFSVRDHHLGGGGVTYSDDEVKLTVVNTTTPFKVKFPNGPINWPVNTEEFVVWDVSSTDVAPINCSSVNVLLSTDGGYTYPVTLASGIPNSGSAHVMMPNDGSLIGITTARIMIQSVGNVFFDISDSNFTITDNVGVSTVADISSQVNIYPNPATNILSVEVNGLNNDPVMVSVHDAIGRKIFESDEQRVSGNKIYSVDMKNASSGVYFVVVRTNNGQSIKKVVKE